MSQETLNTERYTRTWFVERAKNSFKKLEDGKWDFSDSLLLYMPSGEEVYINVQNTDTPYYKLVTAPEHEYLKDIASQVVVELPDDFVFIDLGPGTEHKEQFFFDACKNQNKIFRYVPVDISDYYLRLAKDYAEKQSIPTQPIKSAFEELPSVLTDISGPRFVSLGLTFSNYNSQEVIRLMTAIAGSGGYIFLNTQIKERIDMSLIREVYQNIVGDLCKDKLELLGLVVGVHVSELRVDENNRTWCTILQLNDELKALGVVIGDEILVLQSLRYYKSDLERELEKTGLAYTTYDTGETFVASLIKV